MLEMRTGMEREKSRGSGNNRGVAGKVQAVDLGPRSAGTVREGLA